MHITSGPNHTAVCFMLAVAIGISPAISLIILGAAGTQEQAFGIGSYLLAIITCFITGFYFKLTDHELGERQ